MYNENEEAFSFGSENLNEGTESFTNAEQDENIFSEDEVSDMIDSNVLENESAGTSEYSNEESDFNTEFPFEVTTENQEFGDDNFIGDSSDFRDNTVPAIDLEQSSEPVVTDLQEESQNEVINNVDSFNNSENLNYQAEEPTNDENLVVPPEFSVFTESTPDSTPTEENENDILLQNQVSDEADQPVEYKEEDPSDVELVPQDEEPFSFDFEPLSEEKEEAHEEVAEETPEKPVSEDGLVAAPEFAILPESEESATTEEQESVEEPSIDLEQPDEEQEEPEIEISDTPLSEIDKLTEFEDDSIEETDINSLFDRVSDNFKEASDIFRKNTDLKEKIDSKFDDLKKLQSELDIKKKTSMEEVNQYKDEVYTKLTEKKDEIEKRLNLLKDQQASFDKEKAEFEEYRKNETENIERIKREVQSAYDERREELNRVEDVLRKQKDMLDEERNQLSLDKIKYESDKNELANNLLKFNELVDQFTNGVNSLPNE